MVAAQPRSTFVLDNGAYNIKAGFAINSFPSIIPNCVARGRDRKVYIADQLTSQCKDYSGVAFRRPFEKAHLVNWESESVIWDRVFSSDDVGFRVVPDETALIATEPVLHLPSCSSNMDQMVFEEYGFSTYYRSTASALAHENDTEMLYGGLAGQRSDTSLVIDLGYSATTIVPIIADTVYRPAIRRLDVGGRLLRNVLKETVSFRHYNMMDESATINDIKDQVCYVSLSFSKDLEMCKKLSFAKNPLAVNYVLPLQSTSGSRLGHVLNKSEAPEPDDQILTLGNERFSVPELLFMPSDIDMRQAGLPEAIMQAVSAVPDPDIRNLLLGNVIVTGGTSQFPGFKERLSAELQTMIPTDATLRIGFPENPIAYAWEGGAKLGQQKSRLRLLQVTRKEYLEYGSNLCMQKFGKQSIDIFSG
ncbi:actin family [Lipomyces arxii]|uniref:actin family n=1 Tax=Lipomyces arxii TaxID=56418 RepID=UPI0034CD3A0D